MSVIWLFNHFPCFIGSTFQSLWETWYWVDSLIIENYYVNIAIFEIMENGCYIDEGFWPIDISKQSLTNFHQHGA